MVSTDERAVYFLTRPPTSPQRQSASNSKDNCLKDSTIYNYCLNYYSELNMINRMRKVI